MRRDLLENERLPTELGWSKKVDPVTLGNITRMTGIVANATSLLTGTAVTSELKRRNLHGDF